MEKGGEEADGSEYMIMIWCWDESIGRHSMYFGGGEEPFWTMLHQGNVVAWHHFHIFGRSFELGPDFESQIIVLWLCLDPEGWGILVLTLSHIKGDVPENYRVYIQISLANVNFIKI